jgi:Tfp pilus assembly protein PilF
LKAAYALDPAGMISARLQLANLYLKRHDMEAAGAELSFYLQANPSDPQAPVMKNLLAKIRARQTN